MPVAPVPVAPEVIESHAALDVALHVQDVPFVVRVKELLPPVAATVAVAELKETTAHPAASCITACT